MFTKENAKIHGAKGGKTVTEKRKLAQAIAKRKHCNMQCRIWDKCPLKHIASNTEGKPCLVNKLPARVKRRFVHLFLEGEEGVINEIKETLYDLSSRTNNNVELQIAYLDRLLKFYKTVYGAKTKLLADSDIKVKVRIEKVDANENE